jgi:hypothetical protein
VLLTAKKEPTVPIKKIPTVSRRFHPALAGAAVLLVGLAVTITALVIRG